MNLFKYGMYAEDLFYAQSALSNMISDLVLQIGRKFTIVANIVN